MDDGGRGTPVWDFFVSYTKPDRLWGEWIAWQLERAGYRVLIQAWDFVPGSNWVHRVQEGLVRSRHMVAVLSPDYLVSAYGSAEWEAAWRADPNGVDRKLIPVRVRRCAPPGLLGSVTWIELTDASRAEDEQSARQRLLEGIRAARAGDIRPGDAPSFPAGAAGERPDFPAGLPPVWNVPPRHRHFVGREPQFEALYTALRPTSDRPATAVLCGMGGVGKTLLAAEFARRHAADYDLVWWVGAEDTRLATDRLAALAVELDATDGSPASTPAAALTELSTRRRWLLVLDNAPDPESVSGLVPDRGEGSVLITARDPGLGALGSTIDLDVFSREESVALLHRRVDDLPPPLATDLAAELGDLPLAVEQAAGYLDQTGLPPADYLRLLRQRGDDLLDRGKVAGYASTLGSVWALSLAQLRREAPAALQLLRCMSLLAPEPLPLELLTRGAGHLPRPLQAVLRDELAVADCVGALVRYALVRRLPDGLQIHRLVQRSVRRATTSASRRSYVERLARMLVEVLPNEIHEAPDSWATWSRALPHVLSLVDNPDLAPSAAAGDDSLVWLLDHAGTYLHTTGQAEAAIPLLQRAVDLSSPTTSRDRGEHLTNLGRALTDSGDLATGTRVLQQAVDVTIDIFGYRNPETAIALNNLATVLGRSGQSEKAATVFTEALEIDEALLGSEHPNVAIRLNNLAMELDTLGKSEQALPHYLRALVILRQHFGDEHQFVATVLNNIGEAFRELGHHDQALAYYQQALAVDEALHGPEHPDVARDVGNLGITYLAVGDLDAARDHLDRALAIDTQTYGPDHPDVAIDLGNLGRVMLALDRPALALDLTTRALAILQAAFPDPHPRTAACLHYLAAVEHALGNTEQAAATDHAALAMARSTLPPDHPLISRIRAASRLPARGRERPCSSGPSRPAPHFS